jgi:hypothetical protein
MGGLGGLAGMAGMAGLGKNMKVDTNAISRMTKQEATRERLRKKLAEKKELENAANTNYSLETAEQPNSFVFRLPNEEPQLKSYVHPDILAEIERKEQKKLENNDGGNKGGKKKKNKGKKK